MTPEKKKLLLIGIGLGAAYGAVARLGLGAMSGLSTIAFLFLVPAALGAVPLLMADPQQIRSFRKVMFIPWISIMSSFAAMAALRVERLGCLAILLIPYLILAVLAMLVTFVICVSRGFLIRKRNRQAAATLLLLLPFLAAPLEHRYLTAERTVQVDSSVVVGTDPAHLWPHLATVDTIEDWEYRPGFFNRVLEIPRPIRATVDREGVGARRRGEFANGLTFDERIRTYDRPSLLAFDIAVDPRQLQAGSSERHALAEGYFRFVDATYALAPLGDGQTRLTLSSRYALRTSVNWYGALWASAVVGDFQDRVLGVLQRRYSGPAPKAGGPLASGP